MQPPSRTGHARALYLWRAWNGFTSLTGKEAIPRPSCLKIALQRSRQGAMQRLPDQSLSMIPKVLDPTATGSSLLCFDAKEGDCAARERQCIRVPGQIASARSQPLNVIAAGRPADPFLHGRAGQRQDRLDMDAREIRLDRSGVAKPGHLINATPQRATTGPHSIGSRSGCLPISQNQRETTQWLAHEEFDLQRDPRLGGIPPVPSLR